MKSSTTHDLYIEVTLANYSARGFANDGERFDQQFVKALPSFNT